MTDAIRATIKEMTGVEPVSCPWRAFSTPVVSEVMHAIQFFESGNLGVALSNPSHKLVEALGLWNQLYNRVQSKQMQLEHEQRKRDATAAAAAAKLAGARR
jgi:hypothetical protein